MPTRFRISPLVRFTLYGLLWSLVLPLPFLMFHQKNYGSLPLLLVGVGAGWLALVGLLSQGVLVDEQGVRVEYAPWVPAQLVKGWQLKWAEITEIRSRRTGQGGMVHYLVNPQGDQFLLPMRIAGFAQFLRLVVAKTALDTSRVKPLAQPWMYLTLLVCVVGMFLVDTWIIVTALTLG